MHPWILGAALIATGAQALDSPLDCPGPGTIIVERFISADCPGCWTTAPSDAAARSQSLAFDWIVPSSRGDEAALSSAAPPEARDRAIRALGSNLADGQEATLRTRLRDASGLSLRVKAGPAWNGYFGLQFEAKGAAPRSSSGWVALIETVPEGTDDTPILRHLVRTVAGPIDLDGLQTGRPVRSLQALRWPETAKPVRLRAWAWVEAVDGRMIAVAGERCPHR